MTSQPHDKRIKLSHFGNPNYSGNTCMFQNRQLTGTSIDVSPLKAGCPVTTAPNLVVAGQPLNAASSVRVASVRLNNIRTVSSSVKSADLEVVFNQTSLLIPLRSVRQSSIFFQMNPNQTIASCVGNATSKEICENLGGTWSATPSPGKCELKTTQAMCNDLGGAWNGVTCSWPLPSPSSMCRALGGTWNGTACSLPPPPLNGSAICASLGGSWSASKCTWPPGPAPGIDGPATCAALGGTWSGGKCTLGTSTPPSSAQSICVSLGGSWSGSACSFAGGGGSASQQCANLGGTWQSNRCIFTGPAGQTNLGGFMADLSGSPTRYYNEWGVGTTSGTCTKGTKKLVYDATLVTAGPGDGGNFYQSRALYYCVE